MPALSFLKLELRAFGLGKIHRLVSSGGCEWQEIVPSFSSRLSGFLFPGKETLAYKDFSSRGNKVSSVTYTWKDATFGPCCDTIPCFPRVGTL